MRFAQRPAPATIPFRGFEKADAVVHLAAIRAPDLAPEGVTFQNNILSTWNVFSAATLMGDRAGGLGLQRDHLRPAVRTDQAGLRPARRGRRRCCRRATNSLTKVLGEEMARQMHRWNPARPSSACASPTSWTRLNMPASRPGRTTRMCGSGTSGAMSTAATLAQACRRELEADFTGADHFTIAAADTLHADAQRELMAGGLSRRAAEGGHGRPRDAALDRTGRGACSATSRSTAGATPDAARAADDVETVGGSDL